MPHVARLVRLLRTSTLVIALGAGLVALTGGPADATIARAVVGPAASAAISTVAAPDSTPVILDHRCIAFGHDTNGNTAVNCADIDYKLNIDAAGDFQVWGVNEVFCERGSTIVDCTSIRETAALCQTVILPNVGPTSLCGDPSTGECGKPLGHSDCGARRVINASPREKVLAGQCTADAWGDSLNARVGTTAGPNNEATNHWRICWNGSFKEL